MDLIRARSLYISMSNAFKLFGMGLNNQKAQEIYKNLTPEEKQYFWEQSASSMDMLNIKEEFDYNRAINEFITEIKNKDAGIER